MRYDCSAVMTRQSDYVSEASPRLDRLASAESVAPSRAATTRLGPVEATGASGPMGR